MPLRPRPPQHSPRHLHRLPKQKILHPHPVLLLSGFAKRHYKLHADSPVRAYRRAPWSLPKACLIRRVSGALWGFGGGVDGGGEEDGGECDEGG